MLIELMDDTYHVLLVLSTYSAFVEAKVNMYGFNLQYIEQN